MGSYFEEARFDRLLEAYPAGEAFLAGPARLGSEELRSLQDRRFRRVVARGWEVPFYARRWRAAGLEPGDVRGLDDLSKLPPFSKPDLMESVREHPPFGDFQHARLQHRRQSTASAVTRGGVQDSPRFGSAAARSTSRRRASSSSMRASAA